jgi:hypothetical protein
MRVGQQSGGRAIGRAGNRASWRSGVRAGGRTGERAGVGWREAGRARGLFRSGPCPASALKTHDLTTTTTSACPLRCRAPSFRPHSAPIRSHRRWLPRWRASTRSPRPAQGPQTRLGPAAGGASRSTAARSRSCVIGLPGPAQLGRGEAVCARGQFPHREARPPTCASEGGSAEGVRKLVMLPCATPARGTCQC